MGLPSICKCQSDAYTRRVECGGRLIVSPQTFARRMENQSRSCSDDLATIWQSTGGSVCLRTLNPMPPVVLMDREVQPVGSGCVSTCLAKSSTLCLSPQPLNSANSPQNSSRGPQDSPSGTELARETLVSNVMLASQWGALEPTQEEGPAPSVIGADMTPKPRSVTALCLAAEEPELLLTSCDVRC